MAEQSSGLPTALPSRREILGPGALAGLLGAVVMGLFAMVVAAATYGTNFWSPPRMVAATFFGQEVFAMAGGVVLLGMVVHLAVGAVFGVIYAAILPRGVSFGIDLAAALVYALIVYLVMTFAILPVINPVMYRSVDWRWFLAFHLVYGALLALVVPFRRRVRNGHPQPLETTA